MLPCHVMQLVMRFHALPLSEHCGSRQTGGGKMEWLTPGVIPLHIPSHLQQCRSCSE